MTPRTLLCCLLSFGSLFLERGMASAAENVRPNVLLICVDDLKPTLGCYGDALAVTPNLDRLAARGTVFDRAYCNQAVCSPSRNALMTGLRPTTLGIYDLGTNFRKSRPDAVTLSQFFKQSGWKSEGLGKILHVGHGNQEDPASWSVPHWRPGGVAYALPANRPNGANARNVAPRRNAAAQNPPKGAAYESADVPDNTYPDGALADEAIRRVRAAASNPGQPFLIAVGFVKPHLPFVAPRRYWDLHDPANFELPERRDPPDGAPSFAPTNWGELRQYGGIPATGPLSDDATRTMIHGYYAATSYMDAQLGRVLDALDDSGAAENTIVVVWGDHGWHLGDHGMWCKHTNYEEAARIPLIVVAPRDGRPGTRARGFVETVDLYPTLCELAGLTPPDKLDGTSFAELVCDPSLSGDDHVFHVYPRGERIGRAIRTERYRLVEWKKPGAPEGTAEIELYDYAEDPGETKNRASEQPEVVSELRARISRQPEARVWRDTLEN